MGSVERRLIDGGLVAVLRDIDRDVLLETIGALEAGGVSVMEITADAKDASDRISETVDAFSSDDVLIGAGTVLDEAAAQSVIEAGAAFVVGPTMNPQVIETANRYNVFVAPGVMTPTEAIRAVEAGADMVKVFPAKTVGPDHLSAIQGPLGDLPIMPTGGINADNVEAYFDAGATVVGAGSALIDYDAIDRGDFDAVEERARSFVEAVESARGR